MSVHAREFMFPLGSDFILWEEEQAAAGRALVEMETTEVDPSTGRIMRARLSCELRRGPWSPRRGGRLGVLIPTYNCRALLDRQLAAMRNWLDLVDEVLVLDGGSDDGTLEFLIEAIPHPSLRVVRHPRGLYQGWNAGLALMSTKWVLIATAGDWMDRQGLEHLLAVAEETDADVVISPPRFETMDGGDPPPENWPIHSLLAVHRPAGVWLPSGETVGAWALDFGADLNGVLGSSASNLYRLSLLQAKPFPTDMGVIGDVVWGLKHLRSVRTAVTPRVCAAFIHGGPRPLYKLDTLRRRRLLESAFIGQGLPLSRLETSSLCEIDVLAAEETALHDRLRRLRRRMGSGWVFWPRAWRDRLRRWLIQYRRRGLAESLADLPEPLCRFVWRLSPAIDD